MEDPDPEHISTSYVGRQNLSMRMGIRRFTRLTSGFSKKVENHAASVALYFMHYNFCPVQAGCGREEMRARKLMLEAGSSYIVRQVDEAVWFPIPEQFPTYDEAAEFWDAHDTMDYPEAFRTVKVVSEFRNRHYEIPIDADVVIGLRQRARKAGVPLRRFGSELLRKEI